MRQKTSHEAIQNYIKEALSGAQIEKNFTEISRIADVVYFPQKTIFEVQCSPIELKEVIKRNEDYRSIGFHVIWILHDRHFNRSFVPPAELYLRRRGAYYTSLTAQGHGFFYDQLDFFDGTLRVYKGKPLPLKSFFSRKMPQLPLLAPRILKKRFRHSPFHLPGDLMDTMSQKEVKSLEKVYNPHNPIKKGISRKWNALLKAAAGPDDLPSRHIPLGVESIEEYQEKVLD